MELAKVFAKRTLRNSALYMPFCRYSYVKYFLLFFNTVIMMFH